MAKYLSFALMLGCATMMLWSGCIAPVKPEVKTTYTLDPADTVFQRITDLQDERNATGLYPYLRHSEPAYRYLAARAFGSFTDTLAIDSLALLLSDPVLDVRVMAAFALGQSGLPNAVPHLTAGFVASDTAMQFAAVNKAILEAVGKVADSTMLVQLSNIRTYYPQDTLLLEGQALAFYRFGLRQIFHSGATDKSVEWVADKQFPASVRFIAANYLSRMPVELDSIATGKLIQSLRDEDAINTRMALVNALAKTKRNEALAELTTLYRRESDYRIRCNILRGLKQFPYENGRALAVEALRNPNTHIAKSATDYLLEKSTPQDAALWWKFAKDSLPGPVQLDLYRVANRHLPPYQVQTRDAINYELQQRYTTANNVYDKAAALRALGEFLWNYKFIMQESKTASNAYLQSVAMEVLQGISDSPRFGPFFGLSTRRVRQEFRDHFVWAIQSKKAGPVAIAAQALRHEQEVYRYMFDSLDVLEVQLDSLDLPAMQESHDELLATLRFLKGEPVQTAPKPPFNHAINWELYGNAPRPKYEIQTSKGKITVSIWIDQAPGTALNFIDLVARKFYTDKVFHRVVPNFVVQVGSPTDDAYGSLDYTIRSEFTPNYYHSEGYLGMASAGPDTEGTQWFITHSPTMHLDGRYTLFGKVTEGMDVVHQLQVGDKITSIKSL